MPGEDSLSAAADRARMVHQQLEARGIRASRVLRAMGETPREQFVPPGYRADAYADRALPAELGQTISQPYIVALMTELLDVTPNRRVLEIGAGTGYQTAILARLARHVHTIERLPELAAGARERLAALDIDNVTVHVGDGSLGLPEHGPFDRIIVTAAAPHAPQPLLNQLADGGQMVIPLGRRHDQRLTIYTRAGGDYMKRQSIACRFVPLLGAAGFESD